MPDTAAVFFDVDFTLIHPGPRFQGSGYSASCARHGLVVDAARFEAAVAGAAAVLDSTDRIHDADLYLRYTQRIIELMHPGGELMHPGGELWDSSEESTLPGSESTPWGGRVTHSREVANGRPRAAIAAAAREIYDDWAEHHHFSLYDDVRETLLTLHQDGTRLGLISNSQRCLTSFQEHFDLGGLIAVAVSSSEHGYMKPHPTIFRAALARMHVQADQAAMVGDSVPHDVQGARGAGMHGILLARGSVPSGLPNGIPVIRSLRELPALLGKLHPSR